MSLQHFDIDGGTLAVEVKGNGPLIVCAPGMGDFRDSYTPVADQLVAKGYCVAIMDPRGHGDSSIEFKRYGDEATADDFIHIVEKLAKGPAVLMGNSFAAGSAVIAAGKKPELVSGIVLLGPFLRNPMGGGSIGLWLTYFMFMKPWGPWMWETYAATLWPGLGDQAAVRAKASRESLDRPGRWTGFYQTVNGLDHRVVAPWLDKVQAPVLVVMGEKDPDFTPVEEAKWIASNFKDVDTLMVPRAGHATMLESPELVGERVLTFLESLKTKGLIK